MKRIGNTLLLAMSLLAFGGPAADISHAAILSLSDFEAPAFTLGSVNNQPVPSPAGWGVSNPSFDQAVVAFGGGQVWRVSNAFASSTFGDQPFAPRPGGIPTDTVNNPTNSNPQFFAGESSTGAVSRYFYAQFDVRSATGAPQPGARITVSADNGQGGRQGFLAIRDNGATGLAIDTFDVDSSGNFIGPINIADDLSYTDWHTLAIEILFNDGVNNDVINYYLNGTLVHSNGSWEEFYRNFQLAQHPLGVPVQTLLFRISGSSVPSVQGGGFYIDNVQVRNHMIPEPATGLVLGTGLLGLAAWRVGRGRQREGKRAE
ncbi:MAG: hypothetical protein K6T86_16795 [Pirellulales bacterium]|nr:hypothetical protein [Pirellulales bacterium]